MNTTHNYGTDVVEFFKDSEVEFQELLEKRRYQYNTRSEGLHYRGQAANIDWVRSKPIEMALIELQDELKKGYTIVKVNVEPLYFKAILRKPEKLIKVELVELDKVTREEYDASRYQRNIDETARQIEISVARKKREAEASVAAEAAAAAATQQATLEANALADLQRAYEQPKPQEAAA